MRPHAAGTSRPSATKCLSINAAQVDPPVVCGKRSNLPREICLPVSTTRWGLSIEQSRLNRKAEVSSGRTSRQAQAERPVKAQTVLRKQGKGSGE
jgi:hypothetical protein